ncbi:AGAP011659-PA, partial [Anopheles gambiae str. PEST]
VSSGSEAQDAEDEDHEEGEIQDEDEDEQEQQQELEDISSEEESTIRERMAALEAMDKKLGMMKKKIANRSIYEEREVEEEEEEEEEIHSAPKTQQDPARPNLITLVDQKQPVRKRRKKSLATASATDVPAAPVTPVSPSPTLSELPPKPAKAAPALVQTQKLVNNPNKLINLNRSAAPSPPMRTESPKELTTVDTIRKPTLEEFKEAMIANHKRRLANATETNVYDNEQSEERQQVVPEEEQEEQEEDDEEAEEQEEEVQSPSVDAEQKCASEMSEQKEELCEADPQTVPNEEIEQEDAEDVQEPAEQLEQLDMQSIEAAKEADRSDSKPLEQLSVQTDALAVDDKDDHV